MIRLLGAVATDAAVFCDRLFCPVCRAKITYSQGFNLIYFGTDQAYIANTEGVKTVVYQGFRVFLSHSGATAEQVPCVYNISASGKAVKYVCMQQGGKSAKVQYFF